MLLQQSILLCVQVEDDPGDPNGLLCVAARDIAPGEEVRWEASGWHSAPVVKCSLSCCRAVLAACMHLVTQRLLPTSCQL